MLRLLQPISHPSVLLSLMPGERYASRSSWLVALTLLVALWSSVIAVSVAESSAPITAVRAAPGTFAPLPGPVGAVAVDDASADVFADDSQGSSDVELASDAFASAAGASVRPARVAASLDAVTTRMGSHVTFYDCSNQGFCGLMYNGRRVHEGAVACSWNLALGTRLTIAGDPTGRIYTCEDRGRLTDTWVDVFFASEADGYRWQAVVGLYTTIQIISTP